MKKIKILPGMLAVALSIMLFMTGCYMGDTDANNGGDSGQGGSMARFTINGDYLYTVDSHNLNVVSLADPAEPVKVRYKPVGFDIETIFPMDNLLFIGSQGAMFIYDISNPEFPERLSTASHFRSCDPVVAYGDYAYVTLNNASGSLCGGRGNFLEVYDITEIENPVRISRKELTSPRGLAVDGERNLLFVCDDGISAYDISDPKNVKGIYTAVHLDKVKNIDAYDCIAMDGTLLVIGSDGLYQLGYDREKFTFTSKIDLR